MIELPPDVEDRLREKAAQRGQAVEDYLRSFLDQSPTPSNGAISRTPEEYPREGEDWTEEDLQIDLDWAMLQRRKT